MTTARRLITGALRSLGVLSAEEPMDAAMAMDGLELLNALLDSYSLERLVIYYTPETVIPLAPSVASYTWGAGGVIASPRPLQLSPTASVRDASQQRTPVQVLSQAEWAALPNLTTTAAQPSALFLAPSVPWATLCVWPIPTQSADLLTYPWQPLTAFPSLDAEVLFPPGYERLLRAGLACEVAPDYGHEASATQLAILTQAKASVKRMNVSIPELTLDSGLWPWDAPGGTFDVRTYRW